MPSKMLSWPEEESSACKLLAASLRKAVLLQMLLAGGTENRKKKCAASAWGDRQTVPPSWAPRFYQAGDKARWSMHQQHRRGDALWPSEPPVQAHIHIHTHPPRPLEGASSSSDPAATLLATALVPASTRVSTGAPAPMAVVPALGMLGGGWLRHHRAQRTESPAAIFTPSRMLCSAPAVSWWRVRWGQGTAGSWERRAGSCPCQGPEPTQGHQKHGNGGGERWGQGSGSSFSTHSMYVSGQIQCWIRPESLFFPETKVTPSPRCRPRSSSSSTFLRPFATANSSRTHPYVQSNLVPLAQFYENG